MVVCHCIHVGPMTLVTCPGSPLPLAQCQSGFAPNSWWLKATSCRSVISNDRGLDGLSGFVMVIMMFYTDCVYLSPPHISCCASVELEMSVSRVMHQCPPIDHQQTYLAFTASIHHQQKSITMPDLCPQIVLNGSFHPLLWKITVFFLSFSFRCLCCVCTLVTYCCCLKQFLDSWCSDCTWGQIFYLIS